MSDSVRVKVYTSTHCGYCRAAKGLLDQRSIPFEEIDLSQDTAARVSLVERTGWQTVPVIEIDGTLIGGFMELRAHAMNGGLDDF
jgi:glutaredoxin 3